MITASHRRRHQNRPRLRNFSDLERWFEQTGPLLYVHTRIFSVEPAAAFPQGAGSGIWMGDLLRDSSRTICMRDPVSSQISGIPCFFIKISRICRPIRKCLSGGRPQGPDLVPETRALSPE